jgi:hypothetical protein
MSLAEKDQNYQAETTLNESYILVQAHENANPSVRIRQESRHSTSFHSGRIEEDEARSSKHRHVT